MPRFYLHIRDGNSLIEDPDGSDLPDLAAAQDEAIISAREILAERLKHGEILNGQCFEIVDENGELRAVVPLKDAMRLS